MDPKDLTAPCGIDCFNCDVYEGNITDVVRERIAATFKMAPEQVDCKGCRAQGGCRLHWQKCDTLDCVKTRKVDFCFQCESFPCAMLTPASEDAQFYPHNLKLYNLCRMKLVGLDAWAAEAATNRKRYFKGKFVVGRGPVIDNG